MKKVSVLATIIAAVLFVATPATADITVWLGTAESDGFEVENSTVYGGALGFSIMKYFGLEFVVDYMPDAALPAELEDTANLFDTDLNMDMLWMSGNVVIQLPTQGITPYATAGYGVFGVRLAATELEDIEDELSGTTFFNLGAGAKIDLGPFVAARGEWRMYRLNYDQEESGNALIFVDDNPVFNRFSIGVAITF